MVPWYLMPIPEQKLFCLVLKRAQYSQEFKVFIVGKLNMQTFTYVRFYFHISLNYCLKQNNFFSDSQQNLLIFYDGPELNKVLKLRIHKCFMHSI